MTKPATSKKIGTYATSNHRNNSKMERSESNHNTLLNEETLSIVVNPVSLKFEDSALEWEYQESKQKVLFTFQGFQVCFVFCYLWSFAEVLYNLFWAGRLRLLYAWVTILCFSAAHILPTQLKKVRSYTMAKFWALNGFYGCFIVGCMASLWFGTDYFNNDLGFGLVVGGFIGNCTFMGHLFSIDFRMFAGCISILCITSMVIFSLESDSGELLPEESRICFAYSYFLILCSRIIILQGRLNFGLLKLQAKDIARQKLSFISQLAHDVGTPLTAVSLAADCLRAARREGERRELLAALDAGVQMISLIRNEALNMTKIQAGLNPMPSCVPVHVRSLIHQCAQLIQAYPGAPGLSFRFLLDPRGVPEEVWTDREWLSAMLINYLSNAKKYCPDGEVRVSFFISRQQRPQPQEGKAKNWWSGRSTLNGRPNTERSILTPHQQGEMKYLRVEVEDSGPGVPLTSRNRLFQPFSQLKDTKNGTGLGLYGVMTKAQKMGGNAGMHSSPFAERGSGAVFYFTVPLHPRPAVEGVHFFDKDFSEVNKKELINSEDSQTQKWRHDGEKTDYRHQKFSTLLVVMGSWTTDEQKAIHDQNLCYEKVHFVENTATDSVGEDNRFWGSQKRVVLWSTDAISLLTQPKTLEAKVSTALGRAGGNSNIIALILVQQRIPPEEIPLGQEKLPSHDEMISARKYGISQRIFPFPLHLVKKDWYIHDVIAAVDSRSFEEQQAYFCTAPTDRHSSQFFGDSRVSSALSDHTEWSEMKNDNVDSRAPHEEITKGNENIILVVEDSFAVVQLTRQLLGKNGITTEHAHNGQVGLELLKLWAPHGVTCALVDMSMPVLNGLGCLSQYRAWESAEIRHGRLNRPPMVLIAFTAQSAEYPVPKVLAAGADGVLAKPFQFDSLSTLIRPFYEEGRSVIPNPSFLGLQKQQPDQQCAPSCIVSKKASCSPTGSCPSLIICHSSRKRNAQIAPLVEVKNAKEDEKILDFTSSRVGARRHQHSDDTARTTARPHHNTPRHATEDINLETCRLSSDGVSQNRLSQLGCTPTEQGGGSEKRPASKPLAVVIDDSPTVRKMVCRVLKREGYDVKEAIDGVPGLQMLKDITMKHWHQLQQPQEEIDCSVSTVAQNAAIKFCLCDLQMPGMGGIEVIRQFRAWEKDQWLEIMRTHQQRKLGGHNDRMERTVIFAFSANADEATKTAVMEAGASAILPKPFRLSELKGLVDKLSAGENFATYPPSHYIHT